MICAKFTASMILSRVTLSLFKLKLVTSQSCHFRNNIVVKEYYDKFKVSYHF